MSIQIVEIEFDWMLPVDPETDGEHEIDGVIRRAVSQPYERRKWYESEDAENVVFILDRRIDWSKFPQTLEHCLNELAKADRVRQNQSAFQWAVTAEDYQHSIHPIQGERSDSGRLDPQEVLANIKASELEMMVSDPAVLFHHSRSAYFRLPSGELSDYFLRVGNIQNDIQNLKILSYWSLPHLKNVDHVLSESWTISTTVAYMSQFLGYYRYNQPDVKCEWSYLEKYLSDDGRDRQHILELSRRRETSEHDVLLIISASASGKLIQRFNDIMVGDPNESRFQKLVLFALKGQSCNVPVLHSLTEFLKEKGLLGIPPHEGISDAKLIEIDKSTYIPTYRTRKLKKFQPGTDIKDAKKFFHKYAGNKIFSVSRKGKSSRTFPGRHHSFHVDILKLMDHPNFEASLLEKLQGIGCIDATIFDDSEANRMFYRVMQKAYQKKFGHTIAESIPVNSFRDISNDEKVIGWLMNEKKNILILEAIFVSGVNLADFQREIRKMMDSGVDGSAHITYLVGLFRPCSFPKKEWSKNIFPRTSSHQGFRGCMECVEEILLPLLAEEECPWKRELRAHESVIGTTVLDADEEAYLLERCERIRNPMESGLQGKDVFFSRLGQGDFNFSSGSLFLDTNKVIESNRAVGVYLGKDDIDEADLVCAVASAMQYWRNREPTNLAFVNEVPFDNMINLEVPIGINSFNDSMLRAAIWRALRPGETILEMSDSDTRSLLVPVFCEGSEDSPGQVLAGEAALAFSWQIRPAIGDRNFDRIEWKYLRELLVSIEKL
ncbi:MAG: hypothetical protein F4203_01595 [Rhodobacteraceae bacterium]|nr:hypothetical protein [Paracoccaceae bacterium]